MLFACNIGYNMAIFERAKSCGENRLKGGRKIIEERNDATTCTRTMPHFKDLLICDLSEMQFIANKMKLNCS